ncbi:uncharacterized protein LY89DRAFT_148809 [Mollisia scopiformis]|uniref:Uncharacterized protein n=1 Tax=Mollisia scopiformis TaxID=149040 RepID=A0A194X0X7_MOLSC|nr:uncharacterized protein LY89DRAFT_148809 [Mollisia scopiformis]KUJ13845.1 hypothetical protein LY89DRAFT_148809 [Mollisia scopiformis]
MDLHHFRAHQGSFSPSNPSNPELTITGSQTSNSPTTAQTFIYQPNPLIPQRGILKSIPWGQEDQELQPQPQTLSQSSFSSPLASPSHLLPGGMPVPGAVGGGGFSYVKSTRRITPYRGFAYTPTRKFPLLFLSCERRCVDKIPRTIDGTAVEDYDWGSGSAVWVLVLVYVFVCLCGDFGVGEYVVVVSFPFDFLSLSWLIGGVVVRC